MGKYSKTKIKTRRGIRLIIILLVLVLVASSTFLIYVNVKNNISFERIDDSSSFVSDDIAQNSTPVIIDNVIVGGVYENTWVSSERYYLNSKNKSNIDIDIYNIRGRAGTFKLNSLSKAGKSSAVYSVTTNTNFNDSYFAIAKSDNNPILNTATKDLNVTEQDIKYVKKALGIYRLLNGSVKITEAYDVKLEDQMTSRLLFVTNESKNNNGVYSAVVFVDYYGKASLIKYNYIKNLKNASDWPIYSFKFVADLNSDSKSEIVIQETKEFDVKYDVLEYRNNKFYEVLSTTMKI
jgi:hypothetical protein